MNRDIVKGKWKQAMGSAKAKWGELTKVVISGNSDGRAWKVTPAGTISTRSRWNSSMRRQKISRHPLGGSPAGETASLPTALASAA